MTDTPSQPTTLAKAVCTACTPDAPRVSEEELLQFKAQLPQWKLIEEDGVEKLTRAYRFDDFRSALAFTHKVGELAEAEDHHPAILTEWGCVTVTWWTHKIKGLHRNDFICAAKTDLLEP